MPATCRGLPVLVIHSVTSAVDEMGSLLCLTAHMGSSNVDGIMNGTVREQRCNAFSDVSMRF
jgi:hypothetical protein